MKFNVTIEKAFSKQSANDSFGNNVESAAL
jgi:hypothetical protein